VAEAEGRLVRSGPDSLALLERPPFMRLPASARGGVGLRLLRLIDRRWDLLVFALVHVAVFMLYEPDAAAANAADFVAHAVALGAFDDWPNRR
jgi:hypothetical protein